MTEDQRREMAERISADARHTVEVLADLASAQRLKVQDVAAASSPVDLSALVDAVVRAHPTETHRVRRGEVDVGDGAAGPGRGRAGGQQRGAHAGLDGGRVEPAAT